MILIDQKQKYYEYSYAKEEEIETDVIQNSFSFFGERAIFIEAKRKIDSKFIGSAIPDGFLFDFTELENPEFYIVEIEHSSHDFYKHIFPQITKFFGFFNNKQSQAELNEKLFSIINSNSTLKRKFKKYLGEKEIYKSTKDIVENSQNILLVIDEEKSELPDIIDTYIDTWGKKVKLIILKKFYYRNKHIFYLNPDFRDIQFTDADSIKRTKDEVESNYSEHDHLENVTEEVREIYNSLKSSVLKLDPKLVFNPQRYYISIRSAKNIAFIIIRKNKIKFIIMLPEETVKQLITDLQVKSLSQSVQNFYNGPSCAVEIEEEKHIGEIISLLEEKQKTDSLEINKS